MKKVSTATGIIIIVTAAIVLFGGAFGYQWYANSKLQTTNYNQTQNSNTKTADWKTYTNDKYGFEIQYPPNYQVTTLENFLAPPNQIGLLRLHGNPDDIDITYADTSTLDLSTSKYGFEKVYFDQSKNDWMIHTKGESGVNGSPYDKTEKLDILYTKGGLTFFPDEHGVFSQAVVALSHDKFIIIESGDGGPIRDIVETIASTFKFTK